MLYTQSVVMIVFLIAASEVEALQVAQTGKFVYLCPMDAFFCFSISPQPSMPSLVGPVGEMA